MNRDRRDEPGESPLPRLSAGGDRSVVGGSFSEAVIATGDHPTINVNRYPESLPPARDVGPRKIWMPPRRPSSVFVGRAEALA
ncbi:MAG TPA: hypothetical protein VGD43_21865, partial [Micromonospora sp.]